MFFKDNKSALSIHMTSMTFLFIYAEKIWDAVMACFKARNRLRFAWPDLKYEIWYDSGQVQVF